MTTPETTTEPRELDDTDLMATDVTWDLSDLLGDDTCVLDPVGWLDRADALVEEVVPYRGRIHELDAPRLASVMQTLAGIFDAVGRAANYASLRFAEDTGDPERGAAMQAIRERSATINTRLLFVDLEWASLDDTLAQSLMDDPALAFARHHLHTLRLTRPHLLSEAEETVLSEKSVAGAAAWVRLFEEHTSSIQVELGEEVGGSVPLMQALSMLAHPDRDLRASTAGSITDALQPGLRTRSFIYNNLMLDKSIDDRLRRYPTWLSSRNLANEASDESVEALIEAVVGRYDIPQRWYALKARVLGLDRLADYDRMASVASSESKVGWRRATEIVRDAYASFSPALADVVDRFIDEAWIDAPLRPGKRGGAFCAYAVPSVHPYVLLNWTGSHRDVSTLAHELGHGVHSYLAREQGIFHQVTPLTLAETASVFGETVTNQRLLSQLDDAGERFALLANTLEDSIATVFRQVAMNRFEHACHTERRTVGELSVERFGELWEATQQEMLGSAVDVTEGYRTWWSYVPHFMATPGYVYAYAYGQLLALSVYARYREVGESFVPSYLELLRSGGSRPPEELAAIVGCDLTDPGFWDAGLDIVASQLAAAEDAARAAGRLRTEGGASR